MSELVKRLRDKPTEGLSDLFLRDEAADRIEALEAALRKRDVGPKQLKLAEKYERILDRAKTMRRTRMEMRVFEDDMEIIISALRAARPPADVRTQKNRIEALEAALRNVMLQNVEPYCREIARKALASEQDK